MRIASLTQDVAAADRDFYQAVGQAGYTELAADTQGADAQFQALFTRYPLRPSCISSMDFALPHAPELAASSSKPKWRWRPQMWKRTPCWPHADDRPPLPRALVEASLRWRRRPVHGAGTRLPLGRSLAETATLRAAQSC